MSLATFEEAAKLAPIGTACIAFVAACLALWSIHAQKRVARRRAAIDFFLKTEMDRSMLDAYAAFQAATVDLPSTDMAEFVKTKCYVDIRAYLNVHELIAVGVHNKVFDKRVCYHFWSDVLSRDCREAKRVLTYIDGTREGGATYSQLKKLNRKWESKWRRRFLNWRRRHLPWGRAV